MNRNQWLKVWAGVMALLVFMSFFVVIMMAFIVGHIQGSPISGHGLFAIWLGSFFAFLASGGLMGLLFYSARSGHDDLPKSVDE